MFRADQGRVSRAAAAEHGEAEHSRFIASTRALDKQICHFHVQIPRTNSALLSARSPCRIRGMKLLFSALASAALVLQPTLALADEASHRAAAEQLLNLMGMESLLTQSIDQMLDMQVKQNPAIAPYRTEMKNFLGKYMSWPSMKDDMVKI